MSAEARANGWCGFDVAERVHGGYQYDCDGLPTPMGCGGQIVVPRKWTRPGVKKKSGWLVTFGLEPKRGSLGRVDVPEDWESDEDVVLTYCPRCREVVEQQEAARSVGGDA